MVDKLFIIREILFFGAIPVSLLQNPNALTLAWFMIGVGIGTYIKFKEKQK